MNRYYSNDIKKEKDGREVYKPKIYPNIPLMDTDIYVATETGDRLDTLAHQFYGDSSLGWLIASANNIHNASFGLEDGTVLRIPKDISPILTQL
jgi:hypothetical protein